MSRSALPAGRSSSTPRPEFNPYSLQRANAPKSLAENNATPIDSQSANGDSSRAGQVFNTVAYAGVASQTFGAVTVGRQDPLNLDSLGLYDATGAANAFSVIGPRTPPPARATRRRRATTPRSSTRSRSDPSVSPCFGSSAATIRATARTAPSTRRSGPTSGASRSTLSAARSRTRSRSPISANIRSPPGSA